MTNKEIAYLEKETGIKFRTAHRQVKNRYHCTIVSEDISQKPRKNPKNSS